MDTNIVQVPIPDLVVCDDEIERINLLDSIDLIFQSPLNSIDTIVVCGPDGIGKTTLLKQFSRRHENSSISIFINAQSRWAYDAQCIMHQIAEQIHDFIGSQPMTDAKFSIADLRDLYSQLQRKSKRTGYIYYFIIDGLEDIPTTDAECKREILSLLPFGIPGVRFLLSVNPTEDNRKPTQERRVQEFFVPGFTVDETARFFAELKLSQRQLEEIRRTCHNSPRNVELGLGDGWGGGAGGLGIGSESRDDGRPLE